ncbi:MAG TPA: alpha/beta fold hydrolase [Chloroflexota bacterium]|nr:alpha/beta fold hydrolase [Chloroflexota bacterium]
MPQISARSARGTHDGHLRIYGHTGGERLVILIHGYQTPPKKATRAYWRFRAALRASLPLGAANDVGVLWEFLWAGDHRIPGLSHATYPVRVPVASLTGITLAEKFLAKLKPHQGVYLVAHSLGCRVALEAMKWIREHEDSYRGARIEALFLLAPAVPVEYCERHNDLWFPQPQRGSAEHVLYSRRDLVLAGTFRPGQFVYGEWGRAVGRAGRPHGRWTSRTDTKLGHGDYWTSRDAVRLIGEQSGKLPRSLRVHELPDEAIGHRAGIARDVIADRDLPIHSSR